MSISPLRERNDRALWPVIDACDERCREKAIEDLVTGVVKPVIGSILSRKRGREYEWQLESTIDGARSIYPKVPDPPARFRVLEHNALDEIAEVRKRYPDDSLLHAVILARHGLRAEALESLNRLEKSDPALAAALRESLGRWP